MGSHAMCRLLEISCLVSFWSICKWVFVTFGNTFIFDENKLLYECKVLWNRIVKRIEILVFKGFGKIYDYVKYMVGEWCGIIVTHKK
jgi:hypothetical protein